MSAWWIAATAVGLAAGGSLAIAVTSAASDLGSLALFGRHLRCRRRPRSGDRPRRSSAAGLGADRERLVDRGWLITTLVIVDEQRGYIIFGLSGAALATLVTGVVLRLLLGARPSRDRGAER